ncbi:MAG: two-component sensor histidine kinase, partial [Betaproteobacteria bacterium]
MNSIRRRLLVWMLLGLTVAMAAGAWAVFIRARAEARELFDYQMKLMVAAYPDQGFANVPAASSTGEIPDDVVVVQIWNRNGARLYLSRPAAAAPQRTEVGFSTVRTTEGDWRVYTALVGNNLVQVS